MHPLSVRLYLLRNWRRILPAFIMLAFAAVIVVVIPSMLRGMKVGAMRYTREFGVFTVAMPKRTSTISAEERKAIRSHPGVERMMDAYNCIVRLKTLVGSLPYQLRAVGKDDLRFLVNRAGLVLKVGRLPEPETNEVAMHEWLMASNGWTVGAEFGVDVDDRDWMPGRFRIVGIFSGPVPMGVASREFMANDARYAFASKLWERVLVVPKAGREAEVAAFLKTLQGSKTFDEAAAIEEVSESFDKIVLISDIITLLLLLVVALVVGLLNNVFFAQRLDEFAILMAIGWSRGRLLWKVLGESHAIATSAWLLGLAGGLATLAALDRWLLSPQGIFIPIVQLVPVLFSMGLPAVAMLFSATTVLRRLSRLDPILIIERRG